MRLSWTARSTFCALLKLCKYVFYAGIFFIGIVILDSTLLVQTVQFEHEKEHLSYGMLHSAECSPVVIPTSPERLTVPQAKELFSTGTPRATILCRMRSTPFVLVRSASESAFITDTYMYGKRGLFWENYSQINFHYDNDTNLRRID